MLNRRFRNMGKELTKEAVSRGCHLECVEKCPWEKEWRNKNVTPRLSWNTVARAVCWQLKVCSQRSSHAAKKAFVSLLHSENSLALYLS